MLLVRALLRRDWQIERTYQLSLLLNLADVIVLAITIYFVARLIEDPAALEGYQGTYFDFAIVGVAVNSFAGVGLQGFTGALTHEQSTGTIDLLLASPARHVELITGMFVLPFAFATVQVIGLLAIGIGLIGSGLPVGGLVLSIPILLLTSATFAAVGIAAAGILLVTKRGDPISGPFYQVSMLLSGALFPLEELPAFFRAVGALLPATWGIRAIRELLLADGGWRDVVPETIALCIFTAVMLPLGMWVFRRSLASARRRGIVGSY
jgi:ABC-2 type transport system permease protein